MGPTKKKWLEVGWDGDRTGPFFSFSFSFSLIVQLVLSIFIKEFVFSCM
jgi:hypothetical protein